MLYHPTYLNSKPFGTPKNVTNQLCHNNLKRLQMSKTEVLMRNP